MPLGRLAGERERARYEHFLEDQLLFAAKKNGVAHYTSHQMPFKHVSEVQITYIRLLVSSLLKKPSTHVKQHKRSNG